MHVGRTGITLLGVITLLLAGCAQAPEKQHEQQAIDADIAEILSLSEYSGLGENQRCLPEHNLRGLLGLDEYHLLFEGRDGRLWVNTLPLRCSNLGSGEGVVLVPSAGTLICRHDTIRIGGSRPGKCGTCRLGAFQPVTGDQVAEIVAVLQRR